jgi:hypothetical protein
MMRTARFGQSCAEAMAGIKSMIAPDPRRKVSTHCAMRRAPGSVPACRKAVSAVVMKIL